MAKGEVLENIKLATNTMYKSLVESDFFKSLSKDMQSTVTKATFSDTSKEILESNPKVKVGSNLKDILCNFFAMNETWSLWRNVLGGFMVHAPEIPTYFIPAFTQSKNSGSAKDLKKGEGPRGLLTGGLEGIAIGALVSGRVPKAREMGPYIVLGAAMQLFSSTVYPWLGEKVGSLLYNKNALKAEASANSPKLKPSPPLATNNVQKNVLKPPSQNYGSGSALKV